MAQEKKLFVSNFPYSVEDSDLKEIFESCGTVESAKVITDRETGKSRGFAFVEMESAEQAAKAVEELHGKDVDGRSLVVNIARPRT